MLRLKIPWFAKESAKRGLLLKKNNIKNKHNYKKDISNGYEITEYLLNNRYLDYGRAKYLFNFYMERREIRTRRNESLILLYGGRRFLRSHVLSFVTRNGEKEE